MHYCTRCGAPLAPNARFCTTCGNPVEMAPAAPAAPPRPAPGRSAVADTQRVGTDGLWADKNPGEMLIGSWEVEAQEKQAAPKRQPVKEKLKDPVKKKGCLVRLIIGLIVFLAIAYLIGHFNLL